MNKKHLTILISALVIAGVLLTTLFATGIIPLGVYSELSSESETDNDNERGDSSKDEDSRENPDQQNLDLQDTISGNISTTQNSDGNGNYENNENDKNNIMLKEQDHYKKPENKIEVLNNTPEYEIEMYSYLGDSDNLYLVIDYYFNGASQSEVFSQSNFPQLENIMKIGSENSNNSEALISSEKHLVKLSNATLNTKYGKVYFTAEMDLQGGEKAFLLYVLSLKDKMIKFLYQGEGYSLNASLLSPDKEYIAFNHFQDEKGNSSLLHIFSSKDDTGLVVDNMTKDGKLIGSSLSEDDLMKEGKTVSYYLIRWRTLEELKLREYSYVFDKTQNLIKDEQSYEVSYNILDNTVIYPEEKYAKDAAELRDDGASKGTDNVTINETEGGKTATIGEYTNINSDAASDPESGASLGTGTDTASSEGTVSNPEAEPGTNSGTESGQQAGTDSGTKPSEQPNTDPGEQPGTDPGTQSGSSGGESPENKSNDEVSTDSEALATLKSFYKYVTEGNYERAYDLFDDNFQSVSKMFMGFKISKAEITLDLFQAFAEATQIFSNVKIEKVVKEEHTNDSYKIYYNQSIVIDPNKEPQVYPLVVTLKKMAGIWKITAVDDGTPGVEPF